LTPQGSAVRGAAGWPDRAGFSLRPVLSRPWLRPCRKHSAGTGGGGVGDSVLPPVKPHRALRRKRPPRPERGAPPPPRDRADGIIPVLALPPPRCSMSDTPSLRQGSVTSSVCAPSFQVVALLCAATGSRLLVRPDSDHQRIPTWGVLTPAPQTGIRRCPLAARPRAPVTTCRLALAGWAETSSCSEAAEPFDPRPCSTEAGVEVPVRRRSRPAPPPPARAPLPLRATERPRVPAVGHPSRNSWRTPFPRPGTFRTAAARP